MGNNVPDVLHSTSSSASSSSAVKVVTLPHFLDQWRRITSNRCVLNLVEGHHLQLRAMPPLVHNLQQFNFKLPMVHHPVIQKKVQQLLAEEAIEPSTGGAGFYSIGLKAACLHTPVVKCHHLYLHSGWQINLMSGRFCHLGLLHPPRVFTFLTKPIVFFCHCKGFCIVIYLNDILVLVCSKHESKMA